MAIYPVYYRSNRRRYYRINDVSYDTVKKQIIDNNTLPPAPTPTPTPEPEPTPTPTITRSFTLPLGQTTGKKGFGFRIGDMIIRGDGYVTFYNDYISMSGNAPRLYVYDTNRAKKWRNVEVVVEYMRVSEQSNVPSYAGLGIGVRSTHETQTSSNLVVPTLYFKHTFDGRIFFEKEWKHGSGGYTKQPNSQDKSYPHPRNQWQKVRFTAIGNQLSGYKWENEGWKLIRQFTDTGSWDGNSIITEGTSCFLRNDYVSDFRVRVFNIKEIL